MQLPGQSVRRTNVTLLVKDSVAGIPLVGVACILKELGIYAVTDINWSCGSAASSIGENGIGTSDSRV